MAERPPAIPLFTPYRLPSPLAPGSPAPAAASPSEQQYGSSSHYGNSGDSGGNSSNQIPLASASRSSTEPSGAGPGVQDAEGESWVADRSCNLCRSRRVRCDRNHPVCMRCAKGHQLCVYPPSTNWEVRKADEPRSRVAELEQKLASVQRQLKITQQQAQVASVPSPSAPSFGASPSSDRPPSAPQLVYDAVFPSPTTDQLAALARFLVAEMSRRADIGMQSVDHRLGSQGLANSLACSLMDGSTRICCSKTPALQLLSSEAARFKSTLHALEPVDQLAVAVLCSLGARSSPHSAIIGAPPLSLDDPSASPTSYLAAGSRRETACLALEKRACDLAWTCNVLQEITWSNLRVLAALAELLAQEELRPTQARFFIRNALGLWEDLRIDVLPGDPNEELARVLGRSLLAVEAFLAPHCSTRLLLSDGAIQERLRPFGIALPDVQSTRLDFILDSLLGNGQHLALDTLNVALDTISNWVTSCYRSYSALVYNQQHDMRNLHNLARQLYNFIDEIHSSLQRLQQIVVNLSHLSDNTEDHLLAVEHLILITVRQDTSLIELVLHLHNHLEGLGNVYDPQGDFARIKHESGLRVRMCLKLAAFCSNLYMTCSDKHMVFHLLQSLDVLSNWTSIVCQRAGTPGGPLVPNYEATVEEVGWLQQALEIAHWFTPRASPRLQELIAEQARWSSAQVAGVSLPPPLPPLGSVYHPRPSSSSTTFSPYDRGSQLASAHSAHLIQQHLPPHDSYFLDPRLMSNQQPTSVVERMPDSSGSGETGSFDEDSAKEG